MGIEDLIFDYKKTKVYKVLMSREDTPKTLAFMTDILIERIVDELFLFIMKKAQDDKISIDKIVMANSMSLFVKDTKGEVISKLASLIKDEPGLLGKLQDMPPEIADELRKKNINIVPEGEINEQTTN